MKKFLTSLIFTFVLLISILTAGCAGSSHNSGVGGDPASAGSSDEAVSVSSENSKPAEVPELTVTEEFEIVTEDNQEVGGF